MTNPATFRIQHTLREGEQQPWQMHHSQFTAGTTPHACHTPASLCSHHLVKVLLLLLSDRRGNGEHKAEAAAHTSPIHPPGLVAGPEASEAPLNTRAAESLARVYTRSRCEGITKNRETGTET